jgi:hypothetical protein
VVKDIRDPAEVGNAKLVYLKMKNKKLVGRVIIYNILEHDSFRR